MAEHLKASILFYDISNQSTSFMFMLWQQQVNNSRILQIYQIHIKVIIIDEKILNFSTKKNSVVYK